MLLSWAFVACDEEQRCEDQTSQSACEGVDRGEGGACGWANVVEVDASGACSMSPVRGECVPTEFQGAGCGLHGSCGSGELPNSFARVSSDGSAQVMYGDFCEYQPDPSWVPCSKDSEQAQLSSDAPPACACLCNDG